MISDFHQLSEKVSELAALVQSLRRDNADLRLSLTTLNAENAELAQRIEEAHQRVSALLAKIPAADDAHEEAA
jgi:cell division protein ZapB